MLKIIGMVLGSLLVLFLVLIFIKIKVKVIWNEVDQYLQINYLFYKYTLSLKEKVNDVVEKVEESVAEFANDTVENMVEVEPLRDVDLNPSSEHLKVNEKAYRTLEAKKIDVNSLPIDKQQQNKNCENVKSTTPKTESVTRNQTETTTSHNKSKRRVRRKIKKQQSDTVKHLEKIKFKQKRKKFMIRLKQVKLYVGCGRRILFRLTRRIHVHKFGTALSFNVSDPMINGFLYGGLWSVSGVVLQFMKTHVKKVDQLDYDIQTQFTGNNIFVNFECIVSIRLVDIILVVFLSLKDLLIIRKAYKLKEELS